MNTGKIFQLALGLCLLLSGTAFAQETKKIDREKFSLQYPATWAIATEDEAFVWNFEILDLVVFFCIEDVFAVGGQPFSQVHVVGVAPEVFTVVWVEFNRAFFDFF